MKFYRNNHGIVCKSILDIIQRGGVHFDNPNDTHCMSNQTYNWFDSRDSIPFHELEHMVQLTSDCPSIPGYGNCTCEPTTMTFSVS